MQNQRTEILIGENGVKTLSQKSVLVGGVGGVGGYVCEMLARCGVGRLTLVDFDKVDITNINRQIVALHSTVGQNKVEAIKTRIHDINPNIEVTAICQKISSENIEKILSKKFDFVVDAIDDVENKILLIKTCQDKGLRLVCALGSGNRFAIPKFEVVDISKTENDGLAKKIRLGLRRLGINHQTVVYSKQDRVKTDTTTIGSISYFPAMCGCVIAGFVINSLLEEK